MPQQTFDITAPNGKTLTVTGDHMPTEAELHDIFAKAGVETAAQPSTTRDAIDAGVKAYQADADTKNQRAADTVKAWADNGPHAVNLGIQDVAHGNFSKGAHEIISGAGITALPMLAPALTRAFMAAPVATTAGAATTIAGAEAGSKVAQSGASAMGASPDQAQLAGDVAGLAGGTAGAAIAKVGAPALSRWSANRKSFQMGKDYIQSTRDIQSALGVNAEDVHRARPFLEAVHNNGIPIVGKDANGGAVDQLAKAADVAIEEIEQHVAGLVRQVPNATVRPLQEAITTRVLRMPGSSYKDLQAARAIIAQYGLSKPLSLADAESLRIRLNAENRSILEGSGVRQRTAVLTNPAYVARQEAANQLRDGIYGALEQHGIEGVRDLRQSEGSILKLRNAADPLTRGLRSESTVARTGSNSLTARIAQRVAPVVAAGTGAAVAGPPGAAAGAELGRELTTGLTAKNLSKNELLERAFRQSFTSPPVMTVQGFRAPSGATVPMPLLPSHAQAALPPGSLPSGN